MAIAVISRGASYKLAVSVSKERFVLHYCEVHDIVCAYGVGGAPTLAGTSMFIA